MAVDPLTGCRLGSFSIPICLDYKKAASNIQSGDYTDGAPCGKESDSALASVMGIVGTFMTGTIAGGSNKLQGWKDDKD